jgi:hypothetical protein
VIEEIQDRYTSDISLPEFRRRNQDLATAAQRRFGSWGRAVRAAGLRYKARKQWDWRRVIKEIQTRQQKGLPLRNLWKHDGKLFAACYVYFGGVDPALAAAGVECPSPRKWNRDRVLQVIRDLSQQGLAPLQKDHPSLYLAARRYFGSWEQATLAAGVKANYERWSKERVIREISALHSRSPEALLSRVNPRLAVAARKHFGTQAAAKAAAGIPPDPNRWSKERVIECIQDFHIQGTRRKRRERYSPKLCSAASRYFGSLANARFAAGVLRERSRPRIKWSKEQVIEAIREWDQACRENGPHPVNKLLRITAWRFFGGFPKAMRAAGLEPGRRTRRRASKSR